MLHMHTGRNLLGMLVLGLLTLTPRGVWAQGLDLANRPIAEIRIQGLKVVGEQLVRNQIRLAPGAAYDPELVQQDIVRITHLGRFRTVQAQVEQLDTGSVVLTYVVDEQPLLQDVRVVGNKAISDNEILNMVVLRKGDPVDPYLIDRGIAEIKRAYEKKGFFVTDVSLDGDLLKESSVLLLRVREGPKVRIRKIAFEGNQAFESKELTAQIRSKTHIFLLRGGEMSREQLDTDADTLRQYYNDRGYIDAQVSRRIDVSPNERDATVTFLIEEGGRYTVNAITIKGNQIFSTEQLIAILPLKVGDVFGENMLKKSNDALSDYYGKLGYIESSVQIDRQRDLENPRVDVIVNVTEGATYTVGKVAVRNNQITRDKVILRQVRGLDPGRPFDRTGIDKTEKRLKATSWFDEANVTVLGTPQDEVRDVLIEVKEKNTGSLSFGAGISSDSGVIGAIELTQRNFDIADTPESFGEFFTGKAFRGAGQYFNLAISPGDQVSNYAVSFRDPYFLETPYFLDTSAFFFERERDKYDEQRMGGNIGIGKAFGDVWSASINNRVEMVDISSVDPNAPSDVDDVEGNNLLTSLTFSINRSTVDNNLFPTTGSKLGLSLGYTGAYGGDFHFATASARYSKYWTVDEDFMGRRTVLSMRSQVGYLFPEDEAPIFERFNAGGHRTLRGFDYRGVGPRQVRKPDPVLGLPATVPVDDDESLGGDFMFLMSWEYNVPIYQEIIRWVFFVDTGTVEDNFELTKYRVAIGTGLRLNIPFLGQAPFAFDLAFPVLKADDDETRIFSFDIALPF